MAWGLCCKCPQGAISPMSWVVEGWQLFEAELSHLPSWTLMPLFCISFRSISCPTAKMTSSLAFVTVMDSVFWGPQSVCHLWLTIWEVKLGAFPMSTYCQTQGDIHWRWFFQAGLGSPVRLPSTKHFFFLSIIKPLVPFRWSVVFCSQLKYAGLT